MGGPVIVQMYLIGTLKYTHRCRNLILFLQVTTFVPWKFKQQLVSDTVAQRVVHVLEVINVQEENGKALPGAPGGVQGRLASLLQQRSIWQSGEGIEIRQASDAFLGLLLLSDVAKGRNIVAGLPLGRHQTAHRQPLQIAAAVFALRRSGEVNGFMDRLKGRSTSRYATTRHFS